MFMVYFHTKSQARAQTHGSFIWFNASVKRLSLEFTSTWTALWTHRVRGC